LKISQIFPVPKRSSPSIPSHYRPLSILPTVSKNFEQIIYARVSNFINKNKLLTNLQYRFRNNASTELAASAIYESFVENMDKGKTKCAVFLDLSKAFDTVDHKIMLRKLMYYGIRGKQNSFFESYVTNRKQCTKVNNYASSFQTIKCGVPQGSVMGPLLFLIYVNDLPCASSFQTTLFADDTRLHLSHKDIKMLQLDVQNELDKVDTWMRSNRLSINYNKTAYMILTATRSQNCNFEISMNGVRIQQTDSIKDLGVIIDNKLSWKPQISSLCRKLSQACGIVCKIRHFADIKILRLIYFSLFYSHLQYCKIDCGRAYKTVIQPVQVLQNRIMKYMTFSNRTSSASNIFKLLKILKVSDLYQLNLEKFMYKYNADILPSSFDNFFTKLYNIHDHGTRQQVSGNFHHKRVRTDYGKKCCNM